MKSEHVEKDITKRKGRGCKIERLHGTTEAVTRSRGSKQPAPDWTATFDAITDLVSIHDKDFKLVKVNKAFADTFKVKPEELIGKKCYELVHGTKEPPVDCPHKKTAATQKPHTAEFFEPHLGVYLEVSASPIFNKNGEFIGSVHISKDTTDRKKTDEVLQLERNKLTAILDSMVDGVYIVDQKENIQYVNPALKKEFGEPEGRKCYEYFHDRKEVCPWCKNKDVFTGKTVRWEWYSFKNQKTYDLIDTPLRNSDGSMSKLEIFRDITERKKADEELEKHKERLEELVKERTCTLNERIKELNCLYGIADLVEKPGISLEEIIQGTFSLISPSWQYPENTCARIMLEGQEFKTKNFKETPWKQTSEIIVYGKQVGCLEVYLLGAKPESSEEPFLEEETRLIEAITERLGRIIERKKTEKMMDLAKFPSENPNPVLRITKEGEVLYSNEAGKLLLDKWKIEVGKTVPNKWINLITDAIESEEEVVEVNGKIFSLVIAPVREAGYVNVYCLDITKRKQALEEILEKQEQLRALAAQLSVIEERERRTIAKGLHDEIIQPLVFLDVKLASLFKKDAGRVLSAPFKEMQTIIAMLLGRTRSLTFDLSSPLLAELGLEAAVKDWLTNNIQKTHRLKTIFKTDGQSIALDTDMQSFLYKTIRELLNNVVKHAMATLVEVSICYYDDKTVISVRDDGKGFDTNDKERLRFDREHGFGLFSIKERLKGYGGTLAIDSKIGKGTEMTITMPLNG